MYEKDLFVTYRKCAIMFKNGAIAKSITHTERGTEITYNIHFQKKDRSETVIHTCQDVTVDTVIDHAKNIIDLYRTCVSESGELPEIVPTYCAACKRLFFSSRARANERKSVCRICSESDCYDELNALKETFYSYVYMIYCKEDNAVKIGVSNNPKKRLKQLQTGNNKTLSIVALIKGGQRLEKKIHTMFDKYKIRGEWFLYNVEIEEFFNNNKE